MARKKNVSRFEKAVLSKIDISLKRVAEDLEEMNASIIDISALKGHVEAVLDNIYSDIDSGPEKKNGKAILMVLGKDDNTCPPSLARSVALYGLKKVIRDIYQTLEILEEGEDKKLLNWAKKVTGKNDVMVDYGNLVVKKSLDKTLSRGLTFSWEVLNKEHGKVRQIVDAIKDTDDGLKAFARDLGEARLADNKIDELLHDLWNAESAEIVDEVLRSVLEHEVVKPHARPIDFFGNILKKKLALPVEEQEELMAEVMEEQ